MRTRLKYFIELITSHFWVMPSLLASLLIGFYFLILYLPTEKLAKFILVYIPYSMSSDGAKYILSSIATSTMSVTGVLFSVTFVVLQQAASMYSPRVIENFMRTPFIQIVLGFYIGTFGFSILQLNSAYLEGMANHKSIVGVTMAILLAFGCIGMIIFYVHTVAKAIRSISILEHITQESISTIKASAEILGSNVKDLRPPGHPTLQVSNFVQSQRRGYLQRVDFDGLSKMITQNDWFQCRLLVRPGDYIQEGMDLVQLINVKNFDKISDKVRSHLIIGAERTRSQDFCFSMRQMVDIGLRALSPGINDPNTAVEAINVIGATLIEYTRTDLGGGNLYYLPNPRLKIKVPDYQEFLNLCLDEILRSGQNFSVVLQAIMRVIKNCMYHTDNNEYKKVLRVVYYRAHRLLRQQHYYQK